MWERREIENYLCQPETLLRYAEHLGSELGEGPLFEKTGREDGREAMETAIRDLVPPVALRDRSDSWWTNVKASDEFLERLFAAFFDRLQWPNLMRKTDYHVLARHVPKELFDQEISLALDKIQEVATRVDPSNNVS